MGNIDLKTVEGFGDEWSRFDQSQLSETEKAETFSMYFDIFPFSDQSMLWEGFDLGCGSGRWASLVAPKVRKLHCIDPSGDALAVCRRNLKGFQNCEFHQQSVDQMSLADASQDFGYSLGVLHHIPDTSAAMATCVKKLKTGAPFLVYLYYALDNCPPLFRLIWRISDLLRRIVSIMPHSLRYQICQLIAALVYWPLARAAKLAKRAGRDVAHWPLSFYADRSFYFIRNDALDRFGTRLEQRFSRNQIAEMMASAGLENVHFSEHAPYWCAIGFKKES